METSPVSNILGKFDEKKVSIAEPLLQWVSMFDKISFNNQFYGLSTFHTVFGQLLLKNGVKIYQGYNWIDTRCLVFIMQDSGSGKTTPKDKICELATGLGLAVEPNLLIQSDAYMAGSYDLIEERGRRSVVKLRGALETYDLIMWDEGETLFRENSFSRNMLNLLDAVANTFQSVGNKIKVGLKGTLSLEQVDETGISDDGFFAGCSYIVTTYEPAYIEKYLFRKGFFQRTHLWPNVIERSTRWDNIVKGVDMLGTRIDGDESINNIIKLAKEAAGLATDGLDIDYSNVKSLIIKYMRRFHDHMLMHTTSEVRKVMDEYIARYVGKMAVLSLHHMLLSGRQRKITNDDVKYAGEYLSEMFEKQLVFVEKKINIPKEQSLEKKYINDILTAYVNIKQTNPSFITKDGLINKTTFRKEMEKYWCVSFPTALTRFKKVNCLEEVRQGTRIFVKPRADLLQQISGESNLNV